MAIDVEQPTGVAAVEDGAAILVDRRLSYVVATGELAECTCPDYCDRDHGNE